MPLEENEIVHISGSDTYARFDYKCGHCYRDVSGRVISTYKKRDDPSVRFLLCPSCIKGSIWMIQEGIFQDLNLEKI